MQADNTSRPHSGRDRGFSLVEVLIVITVLGILATIGVFAARGVVSQGEESACSGDARTLVTAAEVYLAQNDLDEIPATGAADGDEFERTLVDAELLKTTSTYYDMDEFGVVSTNGQPCT